MKSVAESRMFDCKQQTVCNQTVFVKQESKKYVLAIANGYSKIRCPRSFGDGNNGLRIAVASAFFR